MEPRVREVAPAIEPNPQDSLVVVKIEGVNHHLPATVVNALMRPFVVPAGSSEVHASIFQTIAQAVFLARTSSSDRVRRANQATVEEFRKLAEQFETGTAGGMYVRVLFDASVRLGNILADNRKKASEEKERIEQEHRRKKLNYDFAGTTMGIVSRAARWMLLTGIAGSIFSFVYHQAENKAQDIQDLYWIFFTSVVLGAIPVLFRIMWSRIREDWFDEDLVRSMALVDEEEEVARIDAYLEAKELIYAQHQAAFKREPRMAKALDAVLRGRKPSAALLQSRRVYSRRREVMLSTNRLIRALFGPRPPE